MYLLSSLFVWLSFVLKFKVTLPFLFPVATASREVGNWHNWLLGKISLSKTFAPRVGGIWGGRNTIAEPMESRRLGISAFVCVNVSQVKIMLEY